MKSKQIFENNMESPDDDSLMFDFSDMNFSDMNNNEFELQFNPIHVQIDDSTIVDLIQNGMVIQSKPWGELIMWINDNFDLMNGIFKIAHMGSVLHTFSVSR